MREQFAKTFMTKLVGEIPDDALKVVYQKLMWCIRNSLFSLETTK